MLLGRRSWAALANLALLFASLICSLVLIELLLRMTHLFGARIAWTTPDPALGYRSVPHTRYWCARESDHPISGVINKYGYRDGEWAVAKPAGVYRIAVLGDSFVEGMQVEEDSTFLALAEHALSLQAGRSVELMNFGRSGDTQSEELLVLQRDVLKFKPDLVLLFFFPGNDIADVSPRTASNLERPFYRILNNGALELDTSFARSRMYHLRTLVDGLKRNSALASLLTDRYVQWRDASRPAPAGLEGYLSLCTHHPQQAYIDNYRINKRLLLEMDHTLSTRGIGFAIVVLPLLSYTPEANRRIEALDSTFDARCYETDLTTFGVSRGIPVFGLQELFAAADSDRAKPLHWRDIGHWTIRGHQVVGKALAAWLGPLLMRQPTGEN